MKSTVEQLSPTRVRINVEVPFDELKPDFDRAYKKIAQQVRVPGFRPGKVPARIIEARLGRGVVLEEVVNEAVPAKYCEAVTAAEASRRWGSPDIEVTEIADGDKLAFTAEVDVRPEITLPELVVARGVTVDEAEVTDDDVDEQLDGPARPLRHPHRRRAARERRTTSSSSTSPPPSTASPSRRPDQRAVLRGRPGRAHRRHRRGPRGPVRGRVGHVPHHAGGRRARGPRGRGHRHRHGGQGARAPRRRRRVRPARQRVRHARRAHRRPAHRFGRVEGWSRSGRPATGCSTRWWTAPRCRCPRASSAEVDSRLHDAVHEFDHDEERFAEFLVGPGQDPRGVRHRGARRRREGGAHPAGPRRDRRRPRGRGETRRAHGTDHVPGPAVPDAARGVRQADPGGRPARRDLRRRPARQGARRGRPGGHGHRRVRLPGRHVRAARTTTTTRRWPRCPTTRSPATPRRNPRWTPSPAPRAGSRHPAPAEPPHRSTPRANNRAARGGSPARPRSVEP